MVDVGDETTLRHLENVRALYADAGVIAYVRNCVRETWRANRHRWSPDLHFDDINTLGHQTSRNVNNRIAATIETSEVSPTVMAERELGVVLLRLAGFALRVVKAPIENGRMPDFDGDFNWTSSATRLAAARRNSNHYYPLSGVEPTLNFESDPRPERLRQVAACKDIFLLWAAGLTSNLTTGWLGLPQVGDRPWMGLLEVWSDNAEEATPLGDSDRSLPTDTGGPYYVEDEDEDADEDDQ